MISLGSSGLRWWAGLLCGEGNMGWKEGGTVSSEGLRRRGRAGGWKRKDLSPPLAVALQCVHEVFCKKLYSVQCSPVCLELCWESPPNLHYLFSTLVGSSQIAAKAKICCCSQMDKGVCLKGPFRRGSQITSAIFSFTDLFLLLSEIPVMNTVMGWEFNDFSKWLHDCFSHLGICVCACVCVRINENVSMMISPFKWKDTFHVLSNHMLEKKKVKSRLPALLCVSWFCWFTSALGPHGQIPTVMSLFRHPLVNILV